MRLLVGLLGVSTMIGLAAPTSSGQAIAFAKALCGWIGKGKSGPELVGDLQRSNPGLTTDHATLFLAISAKHYCPQQLTKNQQTSAQ